MSKNVEGKVVVITGASSGIGEVTAKLLAEHGAKVVLGARREERLKKIADEIGENAAYLATDVTKVEDVKALVALAKEKFGRVDVLFANAGVMPKSNISELRTDEWNSMVDINIKGVLNSLAAVVPEFTEQKSGHIVTTSSIAGQRIFPGNAVYTGTKHFVRVLMDAFRSESVMEGTNIRTTTLYPGAINTELMESIGSKSAKAVMEEFYAQLGIEADAVARTVLFAIEQPDNVAITDMTILPTNQA